MGKAHNVEKKQIERAQNMTINRKEQLKRILQTKKAFWACADPEEREEILRVEKSYFCLASKVRHINKNLLYRDSCHV
jgi:hypothetical protein